jgi:hypothetical protein
MMPPQAAQGGAKMRAIARLANPRSVMGDAVHSYD